MGRVTLDMGGRFRNLGLAATALLLVGGLLALVPARAAPPAEKPDAAVAEHKPGGESAEKAEGEQEEKSALEHVMDSDHIELFESFGPRSLPVYFFKYTLFGQEHAFPTKFMWLELLAAVIIAAAYIPLGMRLRSGELPSGWHTNLREVLLTFVRDDIARPAIGAHGADKYVPFLWTMFLFILVNNVLGLIPFLGSATGSIYVTGGLAVCVFFAIHGSAAAKMGFGPYMVSLWPHFDVPYGLGVIIKPLVFGLEWLGVLVRNAVLAVRLFANMFAGHVVLATILIFIFAAGGAGYALWGGIAVASVLGQVALSLLELFVACLQAYIFTFLAALFMGMAMHPAH